MANVVEILIVTAFCFSAFVVGIPRPHDKEGPKRRVHEQEPLSDEEHFKGSEHNQEYDHEAFLGDEQKKTFDQLSPEESKRRLGYVAIIFVIIYQM